ncbi:hypothetical protein B0T14DRAFT_604152 [Immersiella caudata]|uniref:Uncharacterized protein n=1 Tax=Immersiella caudata TaxID=314043 RepID=A0AA40C0N2_9PEZI|nr:hypothetical protein B0T14DRAFT_604152 [Immersiella caudata]
MANRASQPVPKGWTEQVSSINVGNHEVKTELLVIHSMEHRVSKAGAERILMFCPNISQPANMNAAPGLAASRWLHVHHDHRHINTVEQSTLVMSCPLIARASRAQALSVLRSVERSSQDKPQNCYPVLTSPSPTMGRPFIVCHPFLVLKPPADEQTSTGVFTSTRTLKTGYAEYEGAPEIESDQIVRRLSLGLGNKVLGVSTVWYFVFGPGLMITLAPVPLRELCHGIVEDESRIGRFHTVRVQNDDDVGSGREIFVDAICSYADFIRRALSLVTSGRADVTAYDFHYASEDEDTQWPKPLTPESWLLLLEAGKATGTTVYVREKDGKPRSRSRSRRPYHRYSESPTQTDAHEPPAERTNVVEIETEQIEKEDIIDILFGGGRDGRVLGNKENAVVHRNSGGSGGEGVAESSDSEIDLRYRSVARSSMTLATRLGAESDSVVHPAVPRGRSPGPSYPAAIIRLPRVGNNKPPTASLPESAGISAAPFLTWRVMNSYGIHDRSITNKGFTATQQLVLILDVTHDSILSNSSGVNHLYSSAFRCTIQSLEARHRTSTTSVVGGATEIRESLGQNPAGTGGAPSASPSLDTTCSRGFSGQDQHRRDTQNRETGSTHGLPASQVAPQLPNRALMAASQDLMWRFIPKNTGSVNHPVCQAVWGSFDSIFRQVRWAVESSVQPNSWRVCDFDGKTIAKTSFAGCHFCAAGKGYSSVFEALQHVHSTHIDCPLMAGRGSANNTKRPHDDPCYAWVQPTVSHEGIYAFAVLDLAKSFTQDISEILGRLNELQWLVSTTARTTPAQESHMASTAPPVLPRNLVCIFEELVEYYLYFASQLSLENRAKTAIERNNGDVEAVGLLDRALRMGSRCGTTKRRIGEFVHKARRDILLARHDVPEVGGGVFSSASALGIRAVDIGFVGQAVVASLMNRSTYAPPILRQEPTADASAIPVTKLDVVKMYTEYIQYLQFEAARRPRRRLFLDIRALQDELIAMEYQLDCNLKFMKVSTKILDEDYADSKRRHRRAPEQISVLQNSARQLGDHTWQQIDIISEDHGKAIRVFTIVTVFFLPMTFVSGFFGMNTADIRDVDATQYLYWSIAVPVTLVVLTFAFVYGYRGDEIDDWIRGIFHPNTPRWQAPTRTSSAEERTASLEGIEEPVGAEKLLGGPPPSKDPGEKGETKSGWYRRLGSSGKKRWGAVNRRPTWASQMDQEDV